MKEKNSNNKERPILPEEISKIDPYKISKIILLDGTILVVQNSLIINVGNPKKRYQNLNIGAAINLKSNQISNNSRKEKNKFSYIEWDFPKSKYNSYSFQRNIENNLIESKTEQNENEYNNLIIDYSRDSAINRNKRNRNYSFYESKHINKNNSDIESKHTSCFYKNEENYNYKEINIKENKEKENKEKENKEKEKKENIDINKKEIDNINNDDENINKENKNYIKDNDNDNDNDNNINKGKIDDLSNKKIIKDNLNFNEKIKLLKFGLFDYDYDFRSARLNNEENNIQKKNNVRPLNIIIDKTKNKNDDDINKQFNKLLNKFHENKKSNRKLYEDNYYLANKIYDKDNNNLNKDINKLNNFIHKNKFSYTYGGLNKNENNNGNSYRDIKKRINQLKKKSLNSNLINFFPSKTIYGQRKKLLVLPSNFK